MSASGRDEIYHDIGMALMAWARVEVALLDLFVHQIARGSRNRSSLSAAYNAWAAVVSFDAKLQMLNGILEANLEQRSKKRETWSLLYSHTKSLASQRNQIAHGRIFTSPTEATLQPFAAIWPPRHDSLSRQDIMIRTVRFWRLADAIKWFAGTLSKRPTKTPAQIHDLVQELRNRVVPMRAKKKDRRRSSRR